MKALKWIAIILVVLSLLVVVAVLVLLNSAGIQKSIVMGQLEDKAQHAELEYFKAGFSSVTVRGLVLDKDGTLIEVPDMELDYSLTDALFSKKLRISQLTVKDLSVTLPAARPQIPMGPGPALPPSEQPKPATGTQPAPKPSEPKKSKTPEPAAPFEGIFGKAQSPMQLYIDGVDITATVALSPERKLTLNISGGGIEPGKTGSIDAKSILTDSSKHAAASKVNVDTILQLAQTEDKRLNAIILEIATQASGGSLQQPASLNAKIDLKQEDSGKETYTLFLEDGQKNEIINYKAHFDPSQKQLAGEADFSLRHESLAPVIGHKGLPDYMVYGQLSFDLNSDTYAGDTQATIKSRLQSLDQVNPGLKNMPNLGIDLIYDGTITATSFTAKKVNLSVTNLKKRNEVLTLDLLQPITVGEDFNPNNLKGKIADLNIIGATIEWFAPIIEGIELGGGQIVGQVIVEADNGTVKLNTLKPLKVIDLSVSQGNKAMLEEVTFSADFNANANKETFDAKIQSIDLRNAQGSTLIKFQADASGKLKDGRVAQASVNADANLSFNRLLEQPFAKQTLADRVDLEIKLSVEQPNPDALNITALNATLKGQRNAELASAKLLKPLSLDLKTPEKNTPESLINGEVMRIVVEQLPRPIINAFLGETQLQSGNLTADMTVSGEGQRLMVKSNKPLKLSDLTVSQKGKPTLHSISLSVSPDIVHSSQETKVALPDLSLKSGPKSLLSGQANLVATPSGASPLQSADFDLKADLAALLQQPVLADFNNLAAGTATLKGTVTSPNQGKYDIELKGNGLKVAQPSGTIKAFSLKASGDLNLPNKVTVQAPLIVYGPKGRSDLVVNGWLDQANKPVRFQFDTKGKELYTEDLQLLSAAFKKPAPATQPDQPTPSAQTPAPGKPAPGKQPPATKAPAPDAPPPWAGYEGTATVDIAKVVHGIYNIETINAQLKVDPQTVTLNPAKAILMGAPLNADVKIDHQPDKRPKTPYGMNANLSLSKFDVGKFLTMTKPNTTPPLTGLFAVKSGIHSTARSLDSLTETAQGKLSLNGGPGQLRALSSVDGADTAAKGINTALGIAGALLGDKVRELPALNQLITLLRQIDYETLQIDASRRANLDIDLSTFLLKGPQVRLNGQGVVKNVPGKPINEQPLTVNVSLDAKDKTANLMSELRLLDGNKDSQGYFSGPKFTITGTPASPDFSQLNGILTKAATGIVGGGFGGKVQDGSTESDSKDQTQDAVKGLLKGLLGN